MEEVEGRLEVAAGRFRLAANGLLGGSEQMRLQARLVQMAHVADLSREQLDRQAAEPQGEEIGGQRAVDRCGGGAQRVQGGGDHLPARGQAAEDVGPCRLGLL